MRSAPRTSQSTRQPEASPRRWEKRRWCYRKLRGDPYHHGSMTLTTLREADIQQIREWRNAQMDVLRQKAPIGAAEQRRYFQRVVVPGFTAEEPDMILMSLLREGQCCGYTGLTNLDWSARRAEVSFLVDPDRAARPVVYGEDFSSCLVMLKAIAFGELGLNRLFTETYDLRPQHIAVLESQGFELEGCMRDHVMIDGMPVDSLIHAALREDWRGVE